MNLHGVDMLAIDGSMSYEKRDEVVSKFHMPGGPRVFLFSSVGSAGLNLSIADIVIFFVRRPFLRPLLDQPLLNPRPSPDPAVERSG